MDVKNCRDCGSLFNYLGGPRICPSCKKKLEDKFHQVKEYIYENKDATMNQVAEENEVSIQQLKQWVREERLSFSPDSSVRIECESCGAMIQTGRYCESCKKQLANGLGGLYKKDEPVVKKKPEKQKAKMRFLD